MRSRLFSNEEWEQIVQESLYRYLTYDHSVKNAVEVLKNDYRKP